MTFPSCRCSLYWSFILFPSASNPVLCFPDCDVVFRLFHRFLEDSGLYYPHYHVLLRFKTPKSQLYVERLLKDFDFSCLTLGITATSFGLTSYVEGF